MAGGLHPYAVSGTDCHTFEESFVYTPWALRCGPGNLFPEDPYGSLRSSSFGPFPYAVIWTQALVRRLAGSLDVYFLLLHSLFPLGVFLLLYANLRSAFDPAPAVFLAFFAWAFSSQTGAADLLRQVAEHGTGFWRPYMEGFASVRPLDAIRFSSPSITTFFFLAALLPTVRLSRGGGSAAAFLTGLAWGTQAFVYYGNMVAGALCLAGALLWGTPRPRREAVKAFLASGLGLVLGALPVLLLAAGLRGGPADRDLLARTGLHAAADGFVFTFPLRQSLLFIAAPAAVLLWAWLKDRSSTAAELRRLAPLAAVFPACLLAANIFYIAGPQPQPDRILLRLGNLFLAWNWLAPAAIFCAWLKGREKPARRLSAALLAGMALLTALKAKVQEDNRRIQVRYAAPETARIEASLAEIARFARPGQTVVSSDLALDLALPLLTRFNSLVGNGLTSRRTDEELTSRLAVFAKCAGMGREAFLDFMTSYESEGDLTRVDSAQGAGEPLYDGKMFARMGSWLVHHADRRRFDPARRAPLAALYDGTDARAGARERGVAVVHAESLPEALKPDFAAAGKTPDGRTIFVRKEAP
jgi:hypothetical protein